MAGAERNLQPLCEDYHSDDSAGGHVVTESFSRKSSPIAQANVSTKRSKDLKTDKVPAAEKMPTNIDLRSDSGYSSFTAASKSSADSAPSATSRSPPAVSASTSTTYTTTAPPVSQSPAPKPRRPTGGEQRQHSNESSPRQKPARTASVSSKQRPAGLRRPTLQDMRDNRDEECTNPNCTTCGPNALPHRRRPELPPSSSTHSVPTYPPSDQMSQRSAPDPYYSPPSPTYTRQAPVYASQGPAVVQTARTRRSSSVSRPRPQSFAGDASAGYWAGMMGASAYPSPPHEHGPPPSFSAYQNRPMPGMQYGAQGMPPYMGGPPPNNYYGPSGQQYDGQQRPPPSARTASNFSQRGHAPPIVTQEDPGLSKYSARYNHSQPPTPSEHHTRGPSLHQRKLLQLGYPGVGQEEHSESEYTESEDEYVHDLRAESRRVLEARAARELMPPPNIKRDKSRSRPPLTHAKTSQVVDRLESDRREHRRQSLVVPDRSVQAGRERERERTRPTAAPARQASVSRPPPPHRHTQSEYNARQARVVVNDSRHNRRQSAYQSYEKAYNDFARAQAVDDQYNAERKREKRASRIVQEPRYVPGQFNDTDDEEEEEEEEEPVRVRALSRPRRKTESDSRKGKERTAEIKQKANDAEEYIKSTRGSRDPYADQINKAALKRMSRVSQPSESGSSNSNGSGNRTTMTSTTNNEIRLRVDGTMPLSLQLSGDMEGRTLQLVPAENGMTDLVIGGNTRSEGTIYRSEKSVSGNKAANRRSIVAGQGRRDIEDASERSTRSTRSRRDRDEAREVRDERGPVLRRSRTTAYH